MHKAKFLCGGSEISLRINDPRRRIFSPQIGGKRENVNRTVIPLHFTGTRETRSGEKKNSQKMGDFNDEEKTDFLEGDFEYLCLLVHHRGLKVLTE